MVQDRRDTSLLIKNPETARKNTVRIPRRKPQTDNCSNTSIPPLHQKSSNQTFPFSGDPHREPKNWLCSLPERWAGLTTGADWKPAMPDNECIRQKHVYTPYSLPKALQKNLQENHLQHQPASGRNHKGHNGPVCHNSISARPVR